MSNHFIELREITKDDKLMIFYKKVKNNVFYIENDILYNYVFYMNNLYKLMNKRQEYIVDKFKDTRVVPTIAEYYDLFNNPKYTFEIVDLYKYIQHQTKNIKKYWNKYNPIMNKILIQFFL